MPLPFQSLSHGTVAFGFFNIETDLLLLNEYVLFASDFCGHIIRAAGENSEIYQTTWPVSRIEASAIGDLQGAIEGKDERGLIGEVYKLFPFPANGEDFRQKPEGVKNRALVEKLVTKYGKNVRVPFVIDQRRNTASVAQYVFSRTAFQELIRYIWLGGLPRWKNGVRPEYVMAMREKIERSGHPFFGGLTFE